MKGRKQSLFEETKCNDNFLSKAFHLSLNVYCRPTIFRKCTFFRIQPIWVFRIYKLAEFADVNSDQF